MTLRLVHWFILTLAPALAAGASPPSHAAPVSCRADTAVWIDGRAVAPTHGSIAGLWLYARDGGAQLLVMGHPPGRAVASIERGRRIAVRIDAGPAATTGAPEPIVHQLEDEPLAVALRFAPRDDASRDGAGHASSPAPARRHADLWIEITAPRGPGSIMLTDLQAPGPGGSSPLTFQPEHVEYPQLDPVASSPAFRPAIEQAVIEWDWRMQDGIGTPREARTWAEAISATLARADLLLTDLAARRVKIADALDARAVLGRRRDVLLRRDLPAGDPAWETLWRDAHRWRRRLALDDPLARVGPLLFVKHVPSTMSHQLTQYYGYEARPGGGLFVLPDPGRSMRTRCLSMALPPGNYLHPEVSFEGDRIYFAFCECDTAPVQRRHPQCYERHYHLYVIRADGTDPRRLTDGPYDDFSPRCLPDDALLFVSTRRGGFHRCGRGPCPVYTLARAGADGRDPRPISFHETHEWDPALLTDGRVIYTRWDYVDRNAVFYQQLWTARQDGSGVAIYYGNNTYNPVGTWEARPVPGSNKVMATAAAHHGMTAGSIVLLDVTLGIDGPSPLTRLTPDALFPEAESGLARGLRADGPTRFDDELVKTWGPQPQSQSTRLAHVPEQERRWPGHCYRSPYPLSETHFLAAYSYDRLRGEPGLNRPNLFGLYLCDAFGNRELIYRDPNLSSQWPVPLRARRRPPTLRMPSRWAGDTPERPEGTFFLQDVRRSWPRLPEAEIRALRVVQVLPKTTPHANDPRVGAANASPGKQVLGTVPVESDGSAYFRVPARVPVSFQALDGRGRAVQTMRSLTYLQPGEQISCVGCHEPRVSTAPGQAGGALALRRAPSQLAPGPAGSRPLSYPILVQPVLDRLCVGCHGAKDPAGKVVLTGEPAGAFSRSYNSLIARVAYTAWGNASNNHEPLTAPDRFGARASRLTRLLDAGHHGVVLAPGDWERLVTWMDANALFYGTFDPRDQARQLRGERIAGPALE